MYGLLLYVQVCQCVCTYVQNVGSMHLCICSFCMYVHKYAWLILSVFSHVQYFWWLNHDFLSYYVRTMTLLPIVSLQLLNALFGFNAAVHRANIASPTVYPDSPPGSAHARQFGPTHSSSSGADPNSLYHICVTEQLDSMTESVTASMSQVAAEDIRQKLSSRSAKDETDGGGSLWWGQWQLLLNWCSYYLLTVVIKDTYVDIQCACVSIVKILHMRVKRYSCV